MSYAPATVERSNIRLVRARINMLQAEASDTRALVLALINALGYAASKQSDGTYALRSNS